MEKCSISWIDEYGKLDQGESDDEDKLLELYVTGNPIGCFHEKLRLLLMLSSHKIFPFLDKEEIDTLSLVHGLFVQPVLKWMIFPERTDEKVQIKQANILRIRKTSILKVKEKIIPVPEQLQKEGKPSKRPINELVKLKRHENRPDTLLERNRILKVSFAVFQSLDQASPSAIVQIMGSIFHRFAEAPQTLLNFRIIPALAIDDVHAFRSLSLFQTLTENIEKAVQLVKEFESKEFQTLLSRLAFYSNNEENSYFLLFSENMKTLQSWAKDRGLMDSFISECKLIELELMQCTEMSSLKSLLTKHPKVLDDIHLRSNYPLSTLVIDIVLVLIAFKTMLVLIAQKKLLDVKQMLLPKRLEANQKLIPFLMKCSRLFGSKLKLLYPQKCPLIESFLIECELAKRLAKSVFEFTKFFSRVFKFISSRKEKLPELVKYIAEAPSNIDWHLGKGQVSWNLLRKQLDSVIEGEKGEKEEEFESTVDTSKPI